MSPAACGSLVSKTKKRQTLGGIVRGGLSLGLFFFGQLVGIESRRLQARAQEIGLADAPLSGGLAQCRAFALLVASREVGGPEAGCKPAVPSLQ